MKTKQLMDMMRHISPRYTEEAAARAAAAAPRPSFKPALGVTAGALMCTAIIGGAVYVGNHPKDLHPEDSAFIAEESSAVTTATGVTTDIIAANSEDSATSRSTTVTTGATGTIATTGTGEGVQIVTVYEENRTSAVTTASTERMVAPRQTTTTAVQISRGETGTVSGGEQTYQPGDIDGDGYLTYADFMLAWMYQHYLSLPETKGSYPQMLNAAQIAHYNNLNALDVDLSQLPAEVQASATPTARLGAAVTSLMQSADDGTDAMLVYAPYPELIGEVMDADNACIRSGNYQAISSHAYFLGMYYIDQLSAYEELNYTTRRLNEQTGKYEDYQFGKTSITSEQIDRFLNYLREICIARYAELAYQPGDVDGDGYLTYADYLLLSLFADYEYDMFCGSKYRICPDDYALRLTDAQIARGNLAAETDPRYLQARSDYVSANGTVPERMQSDPLIGKNDVDALEMKLAELYGNGDSTVSADDVTDYFKANPEQYGDVTEIDRLAVSHGCYTDYAYFRIQYLCKDYWSTLAGQEFVANRVSVAPVSEEQMRTFLEFLRTSCVEALKQSGK